MTVVCSSGQHFAAESGNNSDGENVTAVQYQ